MQTTYYIQKCTCICIYILGRKKNSTLNMNILLFESNLASTLGLYVSNESLGPLNSPYIGPIFLSNLSIFNLKWINFSQLIGPCDNRSSKTQPYMENLWDRILYIVFLGKKREVLKTALWARYLSSTFMNKIKMLNAKKYCKRMPS